MPDKVSEIYENHKTSESRTNPRFSDSLDNIPLKAPLTPPNNPKQSPIIDPGYRLNRHSIYYLKHKLHEAVRSENRCRYDIDFPLPNKLTICGRKREDAESVKIFQGEGGKHYFHHLQTCNNRWLCPTCAGKIAFIKAELVRDALRWYLDNDWKVQFLTLTIHHELDHELLWLLEQTKHAYQDLRKNLRCFRRIDYFTSYEILWNSQSGWHPHFHCLLVDQEPIDVNGIIDYWITRLEAEAIAQKAITIDNDEGISFYISKSIAFELTHSHKKKGKGLPGITLVKSPETYPKFKEYAKATYKRRMEQYSKGFWANTGIDPKDDDAAMATHEKIEHFVHEFNGREWELLRKHTLLSDVLEMSEAGKTKSEIMQLIYSK